MRWVAAVGLLLFHANFAFALEPDKRLEQYVRTSWTVDRGLPQGAVFGVTQTRDGYLWLATQEGFVRFDGSEFETYDKATYPQLVSHLAVAIRAAGDDTLYVGTIGGGVIRLRGEDLDVLTTAHGLPSDNVNAILQAADGAIWITTREGVARLANGRITPFAPGRLASDMSAIAEDSSGRIWIAAIDGLISIFGGQVTRHTAEQGFPDNILSIAAARDGSLWIGSDSSGLFQYRDGSVQRLDSARLEKARISALYEDSNGILWVGTHDRGFGRLVDGKVEFDPDRTGAISTFFEDREGNIWIGRIGGLTRLADGPVMTFAHSEGLLDDDVKSVSVAPGGTVWVGTRFGVETVDGTHEYTRREGLSSSHVLATLAARDGSLWVGTGDAGLNRIHAGRITTYRTADGLPGDAVLALFEDSRGTIWAGTSGGVTRIVDGRVDNSGLPAALRGDSVSAIGETSDGAIWVGTHDSGVMRFDGRNVETFNTSTGLSYNMVLSVYEDSARTLWIGTAGGGVNRYKDGRFVAITVAQGLQDDSIFSFLEDEQGNLWMSSNKGIFRARIADLNAVANGRQPRLHSVIYGRTDGMRSRECNGGTQPVAAKAPDGTLWFATTGGASSIHPRDVLVSEPAPPVIISEISVNRVKVAPGATIAPGHHNIDIHYTSPTFKTPDKLRFHYRLRGSANDEWTDVGARRVAYFTNVSPGRYRFDVRAVNGEGLVTEPSTVAFTIKPFFYQSPFFWAGGALLVLLIAWTIHQYRIHLIRAHAERFKLLFDRNLAGVYRAEIDGRILDCNHAFARILGLTDPEELANRSIFDSYAHRADAEELINRLREHRAVSGVETELQRADGAPAWVLQNVSLARGAQGQEILEATLIDITDRKRAEEQIRYQAYHDALTDLPNRTMFKDRLAMALAYSERRGRQSAVLFLDLDRFKLINDTLGHTVGDHLLQGMAERLKACVREEDSVARVGGDEFTVLLMDLQRPADAITVARKILDVVSRPITVDGHELYVTGSIGISMSPTDGHDPETLLKNADTALYRAKEAGKNTYQLCTPSMTQLAAERLALENSLRQAVDRKEFRLLYQPQYDLRTRNVVAVEALLRWERPGAGMVPPSEFIAAAEESRLILPIGEFVLQTAAQQAQAWAGKAPVRIAVNVSAAQFQQRQLARTIRGTLERYEIDPRRLEVEITESTAMLNPAVTADILHELKALGVSIVIDDFGIGHSSLNYLKRFPIDGLKIDKTFVQDMMSDASDAGIVAAVIAMAQALNLRVTAEGVETDDQLAFLASHGCYLIQGYLLSHPVPSDTITKMLRSGTALSTRALPHSA